MAYALFTLFAAANTRAGFSALSCLHRDGCNSRTSERSCCSVDPTWSQARRSGSWAPSNDTEGDAIDGFVAVGLVVPVVKDADRKGKAEQSLVSGNR